MIARLTKKRLDGLVGQVVRLIPRRADDWHVHGVLIGHTDKTLKIEAVLSGRMVTLHEPRAEFKGLEETDDDPMRFRHAELSGQRALS